MAAPTKDTDNMSCRFPEANFISDKVVTLILKGLKDIMIINDYEGDYCKMIDGLDDPVILYCLERTTNDIFNQFSSLPADILKYIFYVEVIKQRQLDTGNICIVHVTEMRDDVDPKYYSFISFIFELCQRVTDAGILNDLDLDNITNWLEENKPLVKSASKE